MFRPLEGREEEIADRVSLAVRPEQQISYWEVLVEYHTQSNGGYTVALVGYLGAHFIGVAKRMKSDPERPMTGRLLALRRALERASKSSLRPPGLVGMFTRC